MNQINIKEYFKTEKEKLRLAVIEHGYKPPSLTIVDAIKRREFADGLS